jgi:hypothetical protein
MVQVKPEGFDSYIALVKNEGIPAEKKANLAWRATYRPVFGEPYTFVVVRPVASMAQFDQPSALIRGLGPDAAAKYTARLRPNVLSERVTIQTLQPELSIVSGATAPANLLIVYDYTMVPGKAGEYNTLLTSTVLPALRKNGVKDYWVYGVNLGAANHRVVVRPIANFAELDGGGSANADIRRANGAAAGDKFIQQFVTIVEGFETTVLRLLPDLSFSTLPQRTSK